MNIHLPRALEDYVKRRVAEGGYGSVSELVREALRLMRSYEEVKRERLREMIAEGDDAIARGDVAAIETDEELDDFFDRL